MDATLVQTIADRLAVAREIGAVKRSVGLPVVNVEREAVVIAGFVDEDPGAWNFGREWHGP